MLSRCTATGYKEFFPAMVFMSGMAVSLPLHPLADISDIHVYKL